MSKPKLLECISERTIHRPFLIGKRSFFSASERDQECFSRDELINFRHESYMDMIDDFKYARMFKPGQCMRVQVNLWAKDDLENHKDAGPLWTDDFAIQVLGLTIKPWAEEFCSYNDKYHSVNVQYLRVSASGMQLCCEPGHDFWLMMQDTDVKVMKGDGKLFQVVKCEPMTQEAFDSFANECLVKLRYHVKQAVSVDTFDVFAESLSKLLSADDHLLALDINGTDMQSREINKLNATPRTYMTLAELRAEEEQQAKS